jgi:hypothetical protein
MNENISFLNDEIDVAASVTAERILELVKFVFTNIQGNFSWQMEGQNKSVV